MSGRRRMMMRRKGTLPSIYQAVEWVGTTGGGLIKVDFNTLCTWVITAQLTTAATSTQVLIARSTNSAAGSWLGATSANKWGCGTGTGNYSNVIATTKTNIEMTFGATSINARIGTDTFNRIGSAYTSTNYEFFCGLGSFKYKGKMFSAIAYDSNGDKLADLIPCYRIADGEIGFYDLVTNSFFVNQGTGILTKGNDL